LVYIGIVDKNVTVLGGAFPTSSEAAGKINSQVTIKALKWDCSSEKLSNLFKMQEDSPESEDKPQEKSEEKKEDKKADDKEFFLELYKQKNLCNFVREATQSTTQCFQNSGFAMFKGRSWRFFMQKLYCVIGRAPVNYKKRNQKLGMKVVWHVDVDLGHLRKVSRQHALVIYNFDSQSFELKTLSRKYPVYVNRRPVSFGDAPVKLSSGSFISISSESFFFMLPP